MIDDDQTLDRIHTGRFGLQTGIFTRDMHRIQKAQYCPKIAKAGVLQRQGDKGASPFAMNGHFKFI